MGGGICIPRDAPGFLYVCSRQEGLLPARTRADSGGRRNPGWLLVGGATSVSRGIHGYIYIHSYYGKYLQHLAPFFLSIGHLLPDITQYIIRRMIPLVLRGFAY